jgi:peptide-methionine (S)-S-oxide reductase
MRVTAVSLAVLFAACQPASPAEAGGPSSQPSSQPAGKPKPKDPHVLAPDPPGMQVAIFAGGCFWCSESDLEPVHGVISVVSGYAGGKVIKPTYEQVSSGGTGHAEAVRVVFDPTKITYEKLVDTFLKTIDPTTPDRQFCDAGSQYRPALFPLNAEQKAIAEKAVNALKESKKFATVAVTVEDPGQFWPAEEYHQDYYRKNTAVYKMYRNGCGRDARVEELWGIKH